MVVNKTRKRRARSYKKGGVKIPLSLNAKEFIPTDVTVPKNETVENLTRSLDSLTIAPRNEFRQFIENAVALDCEMVGVAGGSALAHIAIVDFNGNEIYNKYVIPKGGINSVTNYRTAYSGITKRHLEHLNKVDHAFSRVRREVIEILNNRMIVGHGLINDFRALEFVPNPYFVWDTTEIDLFKQNDPYKPGRRPRKLKALAMEFAGNNIQKNDGNGHSPLEDARASMNLYRLSMGYPKVIYSDMSK